MNSARTQIRVEARERYAKRRGKHKGEIVMPHGIPLGSRFRFQFPPEFVEASPCPEFWRTRNDSNYIVRSVCLEEVVFYSSESRKIVNLSIDELADFVGREFIQPPINLKLNFQAQMGVS